MWPILLGVENTTNHPFLENDLPGRDIGEAFKSTKPKEKEEEDRVLTQAYVMVWGLLMASNKHCSALLDALSGKEVLGYMPFKPYCIIICMPLCYD